MALTPAQLATLKADIAANTATINGVPINTMPNNGDSNFAIAAWYSGIASPDYQVWKSSVTRSEVYHATSPSGTNWDWATYKAQSVTEQNAWTQMFMGDSGPIGNVKFREGVKAIFTGSAQQNAQRDHCFAAGRRLAKRIEKLFAVAVVAPPANTGNNSADARGSATNPDNLAYEGNVSGNDVEAARNLA